MQGSHLWFSRRVSKVFLAEVFFSSSKKWVYVKIKSVSMDYRGPRVSGRGWKMTLMIYPPPPYPWANCLHAPV